MASVLVTGISGFTGAHVALAFLAAGYRVVGTVRSEAMAERVRALDKFKAYQDELSIVIVPDLAVPRALDEHVKNVAGVCTPAQ